MMPKPIRFAPFAVVLAVVFVTGCAATSTKCPCAAGAKADEDHDKAPHLNEQRLMLSQGYSLLYQDASKLELLDLILYVKVESEAVDKIVTAVSEFGDRLKQELERVGRDYPGVRLDLDPLPEMEKRKRRAIAKDRALQFAPVIGRGGREYERTVLIGLVNGINHERHLCQVMAEEEPDAGLKKFLLDTQKGYDRLSDRIDAVLDREYYKNPNGKSKH